jgi:hypothetical protein
LKSSLIYSGVLILVPCVVMAQSPVFLREDFNDLDNWRPLHFPNIERHTRYSIAAEGPVRYLHAASHASASALVFPKRFNVFEYPKMRWRWKVENVYRRADLHTRAGDDYPLRLYVIFESDSGQAGPMGVLSHGILRLITGEHPPHSSLNYVWASQETAETIVASPYTDRVRMVLMEKGPAHLGRWLEEAVDIVQDYERAFHQKPPAIAELAVMNDSDNTGESSVAGIDWIEISE